MDMFDENVVLCVSNSYEKKYYFNPDFDKLPDDVKNELKIMCVLFTEEVGGILDMEFDEEGNLLFKSSADEGDLLYDEIACGMLVKKYQYEKRELLESLEMFFKVFFLGMVCYSCHFDFYARSRAVGLCVQRWLAPKQCCITIRIQKT